MVHQALHSTKTLNLIIKLNRFTESDKYFSPQLCQKNQETYINVIGKVNVLMWFVNFKRLCTRYNLAVHVWDWYSFNAALFLQHHEDDSICLSNSPSSKISERLWSDGMAAMINLFVYTFGNNIDKMLKTEQETCLNQTSPSNMTKFSLPSYCP